MSEKELFDDISNKEFKNQAGLPANQHAKKLAKEKVEAQKQEKPEVILHTIRGQKILRIKVRHNGAYSDYVGSTKKMKKPEIDKIIENWKKENSWAHESELDEKCSEIQQKLYQDFLKKKKK